MPTVHLNDQSKDILIESNLTDAFHPAITECWEACAALHTVVPLISVRFVVRTVDPDRDAYDYTILTSDGRTWQQRIWASVNEPDPRMTFDVVDGRTNSWRMSEFSMQRRLRDVLIVLVKDYRALSVVVTWA